jgi:hypothetical protein
MTLQAMPDPHETTHPSGIVVPDPDQGTPYLAIQFTFPSTMLMVWEPFEDGTAGGHNLFGFARRWEEWVAGEEAFLQAVDPRFGHPFVIPRSAIAHVAGIRIDYHRKEDVRAGVRGLAVPMQPGIRKVGRGAYELTLPTS